MISTLRIVKATVEIFLCLFSSALLFNILFKLIVKSDTIPQKKFVIILPILFFISESIGYGVRGTERILYDSGQADDEYNPIAYIMVYITICCRGISNISWYLWMLLQLKSAFDSTALKITKSIVIFHIFIFVILLISIAITI